MVLHSGAKGFLADRDSGPDAHLRSLRGLREPVGRKALPPEVVMTMQCVEPLKSLGCLYVGKRYPVCRKGSQLLPRALPQPTCCRQEHLTARFGWRIALRKIWEEWVKAWRP